MKSITSIVLFLFSTLCIKAQNNGSIKTTLILHNTDTLQTNSLKKISANSEGMPLVGANEKTFPISEINYLERNNYRYKLIMTKKKNLYHLYQRSKDGDKIDIYFKTLIRIDEENRKYYSTKYHKYEDEFGSLYKINYKNLKNTLTKSPKALYELNKCRVLKMINAGIVLTSIYITIHSTNLLYNSYDICPAPSRPTFVNTNHSC